VRSRRDADGKRPPRTGATARAWPAAAVFSALPDGAIAVVALITWINPTVLGPDLVRWFVLLMLVEFIAVHSAGFLGTVAFSNQTTAKRVWQSIGLCLFYSLFLAGFSLGFRTWWPIVGFWFLTLNRLSSVLFGQAPDGDERALIVGGWGAGVVFYLFGAFATVLLPVPRLGITRSVVSELGLPGEGLWVDEPERAVAFAAIYFALAAWSELVSHRWLRTRSAHYGAGGRRRLPRETSTSTGSAESGN